MSPPIRDVPAAVYLFDERRETFIERSEALGMRLREQLAAGRLSLDQIDPGELSPGEFATASAHASDEHDCRVVLIDSLNGYLNAIPPGTLRSSACTNSVAFLNESGCRHAAHGRAARHHGDA